MNRKKLKYTVIKSSEQYYEYCKILQELDYGEDSEIYEDEIELLLLLIKTWDNEKNQYEGMNPVELLKSLMEEHQLLSKDIAKIAGVGKSTISEILNYKKRMSKNVIRNISNYFKIRQEALNKDYNLESKIAK